MNGVPPNNLRPYGTPVVGTLDHLAWTSEYRAQAFARAQYKRAMADPDGPLDRDPRLAVTFAVTLCFTLLLGTLSVFAASRTSGPPPGLLLLIIFVIGSVRAYNAWAESSGTTPAGAVRAWANAIRARKWERADRLRLAADRDGFPRILPGEGPGDAVPIVTPDDILRYWSELMSRNGLSRSQWLVSKVKTQPLAPELSLVTFRLAIGRGYALFGMLLLIAVVAILLVSFAFTSADSSAMTLFGALPIVLVVVLAAALILSSRRRKFEMKKLVIWRNDRWRIFNGEWQGPEERDLSWLRAHA